MKKIRDLSYEDLYAWVEQKTISKGKSYQKNKHVINIYQISESIICGSVQGTEMYDTVISTSEGLSSTCSCPVGCDCKHGVALILEYLHQIKQNTVIFKPPAHEYLKRYQPLLESETSIDDYCISCVEEEISITEEYLQTFSKEELIKIILSGIEGEHDISLYLKRKQKMDQVSPDSFISTIIAEIEDVTSQEIEYSEWYDEEDENFPDYSGIIESFSVLLERKRYSDIITLGLILLQKAHEHIEMDDDCGSISSQIDECMTIVAEALELSDQPVYQNLLSAIEFIQIDEYSLIEDIQDYVNKPHPPSEWSKVADMLLEKQKKNSTEEISQNHIYSFSSIDWIEIALERAGRVDEAIAFSKNLAEEENRNLPYITLLSRTNHKTEAIDWIRRCILESPHDTRITFLLLREMRRIYAESANWLMIAALDTESFFRSPTISTYELMRDSANMAGIADSLMTHIHTYLKEGIIPSSAKSGSVIPGVIPETGVSFGNRYATVKFPVKSLLIEMALDNEDPDEVLQWYSPDAHKNINRAEASPVDRIADVIVIKYPDKAIEIWKNVAEKIIDMKTPDYYQHAVMYLIKIRDTSLKTGKSTEFDEYILHLKKIHAKKRRLMQELAVVEGRKIIDDV